MKVCIEFDCNNSAFDGDGFCFELKSILQQAVQKIIAQSNRSPCLCAWPESADKLLDTNGNTVGTVILEKNHEA